VVLNGWTCTKHGMPCYAVALEEKQTFLKIMAIIGIAG